MKTAKKKSVGLINKKTTLHVQHTFFVHFFAAVLPDYNVKLPRYSSDEIGLLCSVFFFFFIPSCSSFSFIHVNVNIKISRRKESALLLLLLFFSSKSPDSYAIYRRNARVFETQNFTPAYIPTDVRTIFSEPKFQGCIGNQIFLPMVLPCERFVSATAPLPITVNDILQEKCPFTGSEKGVNIRNRTCKNGDDPVKGSKGKFM